MVHAEPRLCVEDCVIRGYVDGPFISPAIYHVSGIYCIENMVNGKRYIGSSKSVRKRIIEHLGKLKAGTHKNKHLQSSYNKYGAENWIAYLIESCAIEDLASIESEWLETLHPFDEGGYNLAHDTLAPARGMKRTNEFKARVSERRRGVPISDAQRLAISATMTGRKLDAECYKRGGLSGRGHPRSAETIAKMRATRAARTYPRQKWSAERMEKHKLMMNKRPPMSEDIRTKLSETLMGHSVSQETRIKIGEKLRAAWARRKSSSGDACDN